MNLKCNSARITTVFTTLLFSTATFSSMPDYPASVSENITVTIDVPVPSCGISVPEFVSLGVLTPGESKSQSFNLNVHCIGMVPTQLGVYMKTRNTLTENNTALLMNDSSGATTNVRLSISGNVNTGAPGEFTIDDSNKKMIHTGNSMGSYNTHVLVEVPPDTLYGNISGVVAFYMDYS